MDFLGHGHISRGANFGRDSTTYISVKNIPEYFLLLFIESQEFERSV